MTDWYWAPGDTTPLRETLRTGDGTPVDLQGATSIKLTVTPIHGGTPIINNATVANLQNGNGSDGSKGVVQYTPTSGQTSSPSGDYLARITAVLLSGETISFPNNGYLLVTIGQPSAPAAARYVSLEELKKTLEMSGLSFADQDMIDALAAASRGLEYVYNESLAWTEGVSATETRYYTRSSDYTVELGDVLSVASVSLDAAWAWDVEPVYSYTGWQGPGTWSTPLVSSDYRLLPPQNGLTTNGGNGEPYTQLELVRGSQARRLPAGRDAIKIVGQYGWETTPAGVRVAVKILASRLLRRTREAPFGIVALGTDGAVIRARDIAQDPDIAHAMRPLASPRHMFV